MLIALSCAKGDKQNQFSDNGYQGSFLADQPLTKKMYMYYKQCSLKFTNLYPQLNSCLYPYIYSLKWP